MARTVEEEGSGFSQAHVPSVALEQANFELPLQAANLHAERGLAEMQSLGRAAEVKLFGYGDESTQQARFVVVHLGKSS